MCFLRWLGKEEEVSVAELERSENKNFSKGAEAYQFHGVIVPKRRQHTQDEDSSPAPRPVDQKQKEA